MNNTVQYEVSEQKEYKDSDFTTLRMLKSDIELLRKISTVLGQSSTYSYKLIREMAASYVMNELDSEQIELLNMMNKIEKGGYAK